MKILNRFLISLCVFITGCHYHLDESIAAEKIPTISVPYVEGDLTGELTSEIIKKLASSGAVTYQSSGGEWILEIRIINDYNENIGFRYDRTRKDRLTDSIIPVETRQYILVEIQLINSISQTVMLGPSRVQACVDFDHDYYKIRHGVNIFSLGQLTDIDSAEDAANISLNRKLAEKIVDYVIYGRRSY